MNLFIGCSARDEISKDILCDCEKLIEKVSLIKDVNLVYGGCNKGIMKICYDNFKKNNKKITAATPIVYNDLVDENEVDKLIITETTIERFNEIYKNSDIFLFLPGGIGTYSEIFNAIEESRTEKNNKKIIIYNRNYFYTPIIKELYKLHVDGFIKDNLVDLFLIEIEQENIIKVIEEEIRNYE